MRAASAEVAVEGRFDLVARWRGILPQQRRRAHQNAGDAVAALHRLLGNESPLQRVWVVGIAEALQRGDVLVHSGPQRRVAGSHCTITDDDVAGAALARATAEMRSGQTAFAPQNV